MNTTQTFLLIHGAWHGAWCYYKLKAQLEQKGHEVIFVDLPALGRDRTNPASVTLNDHVQSVVSILDTLPGQAVVVGHSYGGVVLSNVCEERPAKISKAIYLTAFMLQNGETLFQIAGEDTESLVTQNIVLNGGVPPVDGVLSVKENVWEEAFYADCEEEDVNLAYSLLVPHPFTTFVTPVTLGTNYHSVPKAYISCLEDRAITPKAQEYMYSRYPETHVIKLWSSHSPFLSEPKILAKILDKLACA